MNINDYFKEELNNEVFETREDFVDRINAIADNLCDEIWKWVRCSEDSEENIDKTIEDMECTCNEIEDEDDEENLSYKGKIAKYSKYTKDF